MLKKLLFVSAFFALASFSYLKATSQIMAEDSLQERAAIGVARKLDKFLTTQKIDDPHHTVLGIDQNREFCAIKSNIFPSEDQAFFTDYQCTNDYQRGLGLFIIKHIADDSFRTLVNWVLSNQKHDNYQKFCKILHDSVEEERAVNMQNEMDKLINTMDMLLFQKSVEELPLALPYYSNFTCFTRLNAFERRDYIYGSARENPPATPPTWNGFSISSQQPGMGLVSHDSAIERMTKYCQEKYRFTD